MPPDAWSDAREIECEDVVALASDLLDGELESATAAACIAHVLRCSGCAQLVTELATTIAALHRLHPSGAVARSWLRSAEP